jgi:hypothetical protein
MQTNAMRFCLFPVAPVLGLFAGLVLLFSRGLATAFCVPIPLASRKTALHLVGKAIEIR